jgi:hypothetical protein
MDDACVGDRVPRYILGNYARSAYEKGADYSVYVGSHLEREQQGIYCPICDTSQDISAGQAGRCADLYTISLCVCV